MDACLLDNDDNDNDYAMELEDDFFNTYLENLNHAVNPQDTNVSLVEMTF